LCLWPFALSSEDAPGAELRCINCYDLECHCGSADVQWMRVRWDRRRLAKKRFPLGERRWSLVWQQQQIPDDATFNMQAVEASVNKARQPGLLKAGAMGHRTRGMSGLYVVGGLDPATVGNTAMMVNGLDRTLEVPKRYVLDGVNIANCSPQTMRDKVKWLTVTYRINEWVIERNAFQRFLTQDPDLLQFLRGRGVRLTEHYTGSNKLDPDFGVMSLAPMFESAGRPPENGSGGKWVRTPETAMIELPDNRTSQLVTELIRQLTMWEPSGMAPNLKSDLVMALWFTEIAFQRILGRTRQKKTHQDNPFASKARLRERGVINISDYLAAAREAG
jgi:hypothetical protein